jgi:hypothetical protein
MPTTFRCQNCGLEKPANYRLKKQQYCNQEACQRVRKRNDHKQKMVTDEKYRREHLQSIQDWRTYRPLAQYQRTYRDNHPDYVRKNREQQRRRNQKHRQIKVTSSTPVIVKGDACNSIKSGTYLLTPCARVNASEVIVKVDSFMVELSVFQGAITPRLQQAT